MKRRLLVAAFYTVTAAGLGLALRVVAAPLAPIAIAARVADAPTDAPARARVPSDSLGRAVVARDPFRVTRAPAALAYDPARVGQPEPPAPPKPALVLVGLVAGADPSAVIEGWPGVEGARVVRPGDTLAGLRVAAIADSTVRIVGMDTVWALTVRLPWR